MTYQGKKKILLHLPSAAEYSEKRGSSFSSCEFSLCQEGMADIIGISQNRVSRLLSRFEEEGLVKKESRRVLGCNQRRNVYFLTEEGKQRAEKLKEKVEQETVSIRTEDGEFSTKLENLDEYVKGPDPYIFVMNNLDDEDVIDLRDTGKKNYFAGRKEEKESIKEGLEEVKKRGSLTLLINGPVGIGKTRLVEEVQTHMEDEKFLFLRGVGDRESDEPFYPFQDAFSELREKAPSSIDTDELEIFDLLNSELQSEPSDQEELSEYFEAISKDLRDIAVEKPLVLFLDDMHLTEKPALDLLKYLTADLNDASIFFIVAYRDGSIDFEEKDLGEEIEELLSLDNCISLELEPLSWKETRKMITRRLGRKSIHCDFIEMCQGLTKGYPLFVKGYLDEMLERGILDPIKGKYPMNLEELKPSSDIKEVIAQKFDRLDEMEKEILKICCCMEEKVPVGLISYMVDEEDDLLNTVEKLDRAKFLEMRMGNEVSFFNEMIRTFVKEKIPDPKKRELHKNIADSILEVFSQNIEEYWSKLGEHYEKAEDFDRAIRYYIKAGERAEDAYANEEAEEMYKRALQNSKDCEDLKIRISKLFEKMAGIPRRKEDYKKSEKYIRKALAEAENEVDNMRLNRKIAGCLRERGEYEKALDRTEEALKLSSDMDESCSEKRKEICRILKVKGMVYLREHDHEKSKEIFQEIKQIAKENGFKIEMGTAYHYLGTLAHFRSEFEKAKENLKRAIDIRDETGDLKGLSESTNNLGVVFRHTQEYEKALDCFKEANSLEKEVGLKDGDPGCLDNMGIIYFDKGELGKALRYHKRCLDIEREMNDNHGLAATYDNMGVVLFAKGELDQAIDYHRRSLKLKEKLGNQNGISLSYYNLGNCYMEKGELERALDLFNRSLEIRKELESEQNIAYSKMRLGILHIDKGDLDKARDHLNEALDIFKQVDDEYGMGLSLDNLGRLNIFDGSIEEAKKYLEYSKKIGSDFKDKNYDVINHRHLALVYLADSDFENALKHGRKSLEMSQEMGAKNQLGKCRRLLGKIHSEREDFEEASEEFQKAVETFERVGNKKAKAKVLYDWGKILSEEIEGEDGSEKLKSADDLFDECGAQKWCRNVGDNI
ncbi:MAG: tetratricopeptide repeat protein [Candidatus Thermoplasmatota archaeon]|nr:tetratricopeptide repeat protein [Candidatus Thermoplasmatota archaeon]